jgi:parallel beta-helix repeat protein
MYFAPLARSLRFPRVWMSHTGRKRRGRRQRSASYLSGASRAAEVLECRLLLSATTLSVDPAAPLSATNYHTIQSAVYAAVSGDTIKVAPGTYNEGVAIDAPLSNLTILGGQAHLRGESGPSIVTGATAFGISGANRITIEGFTIEPAGGGTGILAVSTQDSKVESNVVDTPGIGIELDQDVTESLVANNTLTGAGLTGSAGIFGNGFAANTNNQISNNHAADYEFGIIDGTTNDVVLANTVDGNSVGIFSQGAPVEGNVANKNGVGIEAQSAGAQVVSGNTANDNTASGILASAVGALTVEHNTANGNSALGMECESNGQASILGNTTNGNGSQGILIGVVDAPTSATVIGNTADGNGEFGINIDATALTLAGNVANDNAGDGFNFNSGTISTVSVVSNTADNNSGSGFVIFASAGTVSNNTADSNKGTGTSTTAAGGFVIGGSQDPASVADITVTGNVAAKNASSGFTLLLEKTTVSGNTADGNGGPGFFLATFGNTISRNTAVDNGGDGFTVAGGNNSISGNTADSNGADGIDLNQSSENTITSNNANSNHQDGIEADSLSSGNSISKNTALKNGSYDLQDESTGTGTAGTADTWFANAARTSNPSGLL